MHPEQPLIELRQISFRIKGNQIPLLENLQLEIRNEKLGLIGPNGCGKTTLLHLLVGLLKPESGTLLFENHPVETKNDLRNLRKKVGLVFQDSDDQLFLPTVLEDIAFGPLNHGTSVEESKDLSLSILNRLQLSHLADKVVWNLSGGEKKLVSLATILVMNPQLILLDEPTNSLDHDSREKLMQNLHELSIPLLVVSHDWDFLAQTTSQVLAIENRTLKQSNSSVLHQHYHAHPLGKQPHIHE